MARTDLTVQQLARTGTLLTFTAANVDGHAYTNDDRTALYVKNGGGGSVTLTFVTPVTTDSLAVADHTVAVPAGSERIVSGLTTGTFNQIAGADAGQVQVDFSGVTTVTCAAFRV
jgi:hypothetical protein